MSWPTERLSWPTERRHELATPVARVESTRATGIPGLGRVELSGDGQPARRPVQELGRLPWFAALFLRAFFFRDFFAMLTSS
ncbi:hypothetical protein [Micromonospora sp. NPDC005710]|uniref:hypothetical protein n=1 Tax=Micromonospora sp. NPDC005710 TaxID=3157051 RepID=UPI0033EBA00E